MTFVLSVTIKIALLTLVALAATTLLRRRSAALRHWVLATALFGCLGIPALELFMPAWSIPLPVTWSSSSADSSLRLVSEPAPLAGSALRAGVQGPNVSRMAGLPDIVFILTTIWVVGVVVGVVVLTAGLWRLRTLAAEDLRSRRA